MESLWRGNLLSHNVPGFIHFRILFSVARLFYPFINISTTDFSFSLSLSRLWKLAFIYTNSTKNQRIKNVLFVGWVLFFSNLKKIICRSGNGENILCSYFPSEAGVNRIYSATFRTVSSGRRKKNVNGKRMFYFSEWKYKIADLCCFMSPQKLTLMTEATSQLSHVAAELDYSLHFYFRISICFDHCVRICVSTCACEICMAVCLWVHAGMWKTGSKGMGELYSSECSVFIHGLA